MNLDRALLEELLAEYRIPGAVVGVLHDGELTAIAAGVRDVTTGEPTTPDTVHQIGSMTKTWTALAFLQLVDEGRAALDEPVRTWLPTFRVADPCTSADLTPRQLLNHTNGIEEDYGDPGEGDDVLARMVANIAGARQVHPLGATHGYSAALGYAILGRILEVVDGRPWHAVLRDRLFDPLGLTGTTALPGRVAGTATGHIVRSLDEGAVVSPIEHLPRAFGPGGTVSSTIGEVLALGRLVLTGGGGILSPSTMREMTHSRVPVPDPYLFGPQWALGLIVCDWQGETVYASDGSTIGQHARLRILPESGTAVALLANAGPRESFYQRLFAEILGRAIPGPPEPDLSLTLDPARYDGVYRRPGTRFEIADLRLTRFIDPMQAAFTGRPERLEHPLLPIDETHFLIPSTDPAEDATTCAIYEVDGVRYLHTNCRVHPRTER